MNTGSWAEPAEATSSIIRKGESGRGRNLLISRQESSGHWSGMLFCGWLQLTRLFQGLDELSFEAS